MSDATIYPCPVCGYFVFDEPPGSYAICPICFWEDDQIQLGYPLMAGGANSVSLFEAQKQFMREGASEYRFTGPVRRPTDSDSRDPQWRPFDPNKDPHLHWDLETDHERWRASGMAACLYYWRDDYWLLPKKAS
ncbi:MAG: CPCC family cysteine-rich protein [Pyrinomonadaceae bacterium]